MTTNSFIRDLDLGEFNRLDGRRIEVIADGLSLWQGAQLAIDTTLVSPLHPDGSARRGAASRPGLALEQARRRKETTYPELVGDEGRARLVVLAAETGGRWFYRDSTVPQRPCEGQSRNGTTPHAEPCQGSVVEKVELHLGVQCNKAFTLSLLERRPNPGARVDIPSEQEVLRDDRFG